MKKILLSLFVAIILAIFCTPFLTGMLFEKKVQALVQHVNAIPGVSVTVNNYQRGWLTSTATLDLQAQSTALSKKLRLPSDITLLHTVEQCKVAHGPVILASISGKRQLTYGQAYMACVAHPASTQQTQLANKNMDIDLQVHFDGKVSSHIDFDALAYSDKKSGYSILLKNGDIAIDINSQFNKINSTVSVASAEFNEQNSALQIKGIKSQGDFSKSDYNIWSGQHHSHVASATISQQGVPLVKLDDQVYESVTMVDGNVVNKSYLLNIENIGSLGKNVGPIKLNVGFYNLDAQALSQLLAVSKTWAQQLFKSHSAANSQRYAKEVQELLPTLLSRGFRLKLDPIYIQMPEGRISLQADVIFPDQQGNSASIDELLLNSDASFVVTLPIEFVKTQLINAYQLNQLRNNGAAKQNMDKIKEKVDVLLKQLLANGTITTKGDDYLFSLDFKQQKAYFNGVEAPSVDAVMAKWMPVAIFLTVEEPVNVNDSVSGSPLPQCSQSAGENDE